MVPLASFWSIGFKGSHCYRDLRHIFHCLKVAPSNKDAIYYEHRIPSTTIYGGLIGPRFASAASPSATRVSTLFVSSYRFSSVDGESEIDRSSESVGVLWHHATQSQDGRKSYCPGATWQGGNGNHAVTRGVDPCLAFAGACIRHHFYHSFFSAQHNTIQKLSLIHI